VPQRFGGSLRLFALDIEDRHSGALFCESLCDPEAIVLRATRDDDDSIRHAHKIRPSETLALALKAPRRLRKGTESDRGISIMENTFIDEETGSMDWEQLTYFRATARREHMGRAAEDLGVSQSTLSRSIGRLEQRYGVLLFDRVKRGLRLNAFGRALLVRVERALLELENGEREIHEIAQLADRQVALGFFGSLGTRLVPELIVSFQRRYPDVHFRLLQGDFALLRDGLMTGQIDLCLTSPRHLEPEFAWQPLWDEELIALVPHDNALAQRADIDLHDLALEPMVALREGIGLRQDLDRLALEANFTPRIVFEGSEVATLVGLVGAGFGVALIPRNVAESQSIAKAIRIRSPRCYRRIGVSWRNDRFSTEIVAAFREHVGAHHPKAFLTRGTGETTRDPAPLI